MEVPQVTRGGRLLQRNILPEDRHCFGYGKEGHFALDYPENTEPILTAGSTTSHFPYSYFSTGWVETCESAPCFPVRVRGRDTERPSWIQGVASLWYDLSFHLGWSRTPLTELPIPGESFHLTAFAGWGIPHYLVNRPQSLPIRMGIGRSRMTPTHMDTVPFGEQIVPRLVG